MHYEYVRTRNRWHKVVVDSAGVRSTERCNLDDAKLGPRTPDEPAADQPRCKWCMD